MGACLADNPHPIFSCLLDGGNTDVDCDCSKPPSGKQPGETAPVCVETEDATGTDCVPLVLATEHATEVGTVCLKVIGNDKPVLELTYQSSEYYSLVQNHFWVGLGDLQELPSTAYGSPDVDLFPYYWCDYAGDDHWRTPIPAINLTLACKSGFLEPHQGARELNGSGQLHYYSELHHDGDNDDTKW